MKTLAINGFGRIGRSILRASLQEQYRNKIVVRAIHDIAHGEILSYLLAHDSTHGALPHSVHYKENSLHFEVESAFAPIRVSHKEEECVFNDIDILIQSSGQLTSKLELQKYIDKGAKRVLLTCAPTDSIPSFVLGGNLSPNTLCKPSTHYAGFLESDESNLHTLRQAQIFSNSSCTANALAPLCRVLDSHFGIEMASICITHSYTNEQPLLDSAVCGDKRRSRSAAVNIIPTSTGVVHALESILPCLRDKLSGHSVRVPVSNVLLLDISVVLRKTTSLESLNSAIIEASKSEFMGIIGIDEDYGVSSDFIGNPHSVIFAPDLSSLVHGKMARLLAWCDNEWGYAHRVLDLALLACRE